MKKLYLLLITLASVFSVHSQPIYSDNTWKATSTLYSGWELPGYNDSGWGTSAAPNPGTGSYTCKDHNLFDANIIPMWSTPQLQYAYLRKSFTVADVSTMCSDTLTAGADDDIDVYVNGTLVINDVNSVAGPTVARNVLPYLVNGNNVIAVRGNNTGGFCRVCLVFNTPGGGAFSVNAGPDSTICANDSAHLNVTGAPGGSSITWTPATGLSCSNCANPAASPADTTTYIVEVNNGNCISRDTVTVNVIPAVVASVSPQDTSICSGNYVQFEASGGTDYLWSPSTGLSDSTAANPVAIPLTTTVYSVAVSSGNCPASILTDTIHVSPSPPVPNLVQSFDTLFCSYDSSYKSYQWYDSTTLIPGGTNPVLVISKNGNYNIQVTNENGCSIAVGINVILTDVSMFTVYGLPFTVSPNPVVNELKINPVNAAEFKISHFYIYSVLGERVYSSVPEALNIKSETVINVSSLRAGIYFLKITGEKSSRVIRFVKSSCLK